MFSVAKKIKNNSSDSNSKDKALIQSFVSDIESHYDITLHESSICKPYGCYLTYTKHLLMSSVILEVNEYYLFQFNVTMANITSTV